MQRVDVDIEFGHYTLGADDVGIELQGVHQSSLAAGFLIEQLENLGYSWITSVLVDDKRQKPNLTVRQCVEALETELEGVPVTRALMESSLIRLQERFFAIVRADALDKVKEEFEDYFERHHALACSQDISLWHALRFGLLEFDAGDLAESEAYGFNLQTQPRCLVSVLPSSYSDFENRAEKQYLRKLAGGGIPQRIYQFYVDRSEPLTKNQIEARARELAFRIDGSLSPESSDPRA